MTLHARSQFTQWTSQRSPGSKEHAQKLRSAPSLTKPGNNLDDPEQDDDRSSTTAASRCPLPAHATNVPSKRMTAGQESLIDLSAILYNDIDRRSISVAFGKCKTEAADGDDALPHIDTGGSDRGHCIRIDVNEGQIFAKPPETNHPMVIAVQVYANYVNATAVSDDSVQGRQQELQKKSEGVLIYVDPLPHIPVAVLVLVIAVLILVVFGILAWLLEM